MDVTKSTFNETLPQLKETIDNATFLCIDCEMTGLRTTNNINSFDLQKHYYEKVRKNCKEFLVIQFGICAFRYDEENNVFKQQAYNFYVFPNVVNKYVPNRCFLSQVSSIEFLVSQGFNFNKLFREGVPYLNSLEEMKYRDALAEAQKMRANNLNSPQEDTKRLVPIPDSDRPFMDDIAERLEKFIESDDSEVTLPKCNAFLRMLIYQSVRTKFDKTIYLKSRTLDNKDKVLIACKITHDECLVDEENKRVREEHDELDNNIGFSKVIKHIVESEKLIVGHNMCLDLLQTVDKFLAPLPEDYDEFKDCVHCMFPKVLDTKYMSSTETFKDLIASNVLINLLECVSKEPFELPKTEIEENGRGYDLKHAKEHEAGYDAYMTGMCFLSMWGYLGRRAKLSPNETFRDFKLLKPYVNRLFLMRLQDSPYIHLGGVDPSPARDHVFYLTFPKDWKTSDIQQLFSPFGNVMISWIDDHSAYIGLYNRLQVAVALSTLSQSDTYKIMTYAKRQAILDGLNTFTVSPLPASRRRLSDGLNTSSKSRRTSSCGEGSYPRRSIETIVECPETEGAKTAKQRGAKSEIVPVVKSSRKRTISKTFEEDNTWD